MKLRRKGILFVVFLAAVFQVGAGNASAAALRASLGGMIIRKEVKSIKDLRFRNIVRQTKDYSCGAAALATMLTYYMGRETSEEEVLRGIVKQADQKEMDKIQKTGLSLLNLKVFVESIGFQAAGYRLPPKSLEKVGRPAIALIQYKGYTHFVVVKGASDEKVFIADPVLGNLERNLSEFSHMWGGILLFLADPDKENPLSQPFSVAYRVPKGTLLSNRANLNVLGSFINPLEFR